MPLGCPLASHSSVQDTAQQLAQAQADADQRALDAATALAAASEESARETPGSPQKGEVWSWDALSTMHTELS